MTVKGSPLAVAAVAVLLAGVICSCGPAATGEVGPTCDEIADHLQAICSSKPYSERARSDCRVYGMDKATRTCLVKAAECSASSIDLPCNYSQTPIACTATSECHSLFMCFAGHCAPCGADTDCATGEVCRNDVCFVPDPV